MAIGDRGRNRFLAWISVFGAGALIAASFVSHADAAGYREKILHRFCPQGGSICGDGATPHAGLIMDQAGNLYGTTNGGGGRKDSGVVFELTPDKTRATGWAKTILYRFCRRANCTDGANPVSGLIMDEQGNLYGTTSEGGNKSSTCVVFNRSEACGVLFELTPNQTRTAWTETVLYDFCSQTNCADGFFPSGGLIMNPLGNLFGTTQFGGNGSDGLGVVFELTPNATHTAWTETILHSFCSDYPRCPDGAQPTGTLIMDTAGNLYGSATNGLVEGGVVFELTPKTTGTAWTETFLYSFCCGVLDGENPFGALMMDGAGNLYGTTSGGGRVEGGGSGVVFELTPNETRTAWTETVLHRFCSRADCADGAYPYAGLIMDRAGNLYGTTYGGGPGSCNFVGCGVVYELTPNPTGTTWKETVLHRFCSRTNCTDGAAPLAGLIMDGAGNLHGTTAQGGINGRGVVFELEKLP